MLRPFLFDEFMTLQRSFDDIFKRLYADDVRKQASTTPESAWTPAVESVVQNGELIIRAFLPGIESSQVSLTLTDNVLTLRGNRAQQDADTRVLFSEVPRGSFERKIALPEDVLTDTEKCAATLVNGVLEIRLPVVSQYLQSREIPIQTATDVKQLA